MNPPTILIVDDDPLTRKLVRVTLQSEGYHVLAAEDGRSTLDVMRTHRPDLVLQDLILPDLDGLQLVQQLRALPGCAGLPILALSGSGSRMGNAQRLHAGFTDFLLKPVEPSQLLAVVRRHLAPAQAPQQPPGCGRRILVVDDDPLQLKLLRIRLEQAGFAVATADDGADALDQALRLPPDAILSDMLMPRLDGLKFCLAVRQDPALAHIPVVLTSAASIEEADRRLALGVGANAFVPRTADLQDVLQALLAGLEQGAPPPGGSVAGPPTTEYADRPAGQQGRQAAINAGLAQRLAWIEAKLAILGGLAETMKRSSATRPLVDDILYRALEILGAPRGAAYLLEPDGRLSLRTEFGYPLDHTGPLADFFGHMDLLRRALEEGAPLELPSPRIPEAAAELLPRAGAGSMLITPLLSGDERLGALALAWTGAEREGDWGSILAAVVSQVSQAIALANALSQLRESEGRLAFLARASALLSRSLDYETTLANVVKLAVPGFADWCAVEVMGEDGSIRQLAVTHADPAKVKQARELQTNYPARGNDPYGVAEAIRTGKTQFYPELSPPQLAAVARDSRHLHLLRRFGPKSVMIVPMVVRGEVLAAVTFAQAESGRRYSEADLALAEELARRCALALDNARLYKEAQRAVAMRDEFISIAAHELRTPMTSLRGFAQLGLRQFEDTAVLDPARIRRALEVIDHQSDKLVRLVSQLLDVSRIESGKLVLDRKEVEVRSLVEGVVAGAAARTGRDNLVLQDGEPVPALVDPLRLEQVVVNLVDNAIKYSPNGAQIDVEVGVEAPGAVRLAVRDRGIGIPPEHRERVFDRFYQSHSGHQGGMGLGLYVARHIVDLHGGRIWVESPEDGGSRFVVNLPTEPPDAPPLPFPAPSPSRGKGSD